jgi:DNA repair protein RadC
MEEYREYRSFTIHDLPNSERPRERMQRLGAEILSAQELLAIVLGKGISGESVTVTVQRLFDKFESLSNIANASIEELRSIRGIGLAKACQVKAAFELANRWDKSNTNPEKQVIKTPEEAYTQFKCKFRGKKRSISGLYSWIQETK